VPHRRTRFISPYLKKQAKLWPVVGVVGLRQSGKTTLFREQLGIANYITLDDDDYQQSAIDSPKIFLARQNRPVVIDEIQKAPRLFDAIKMSVDNKRIPGQFYVTGSSQFSSRIGVRESLTGRIGLCQLFPMTLAEAQQAHPLKGLPELEEGLRGRFSWEELLFHAQRGGMPVPMFLRNESQVKDYWKGWLETTIYRDLALCFKKSYQPEITKGILRSIGKSLIQGELPTLTSFDYDSRRLRNYLEAMETIFLVRRISCHEMGVGKEIWILGDSGLAGYVMGDVKSSSAVLSLIRHALWTETSSLMGFHGMTDDRCYFKSIRGSAVDWIWNNSPMKIVTSLQQRSFLERSLEGAMQKLGSRHGYLIAPVGHAEIPPKSGGIGVLPWTTWS
jgi:hypothetical protein